MKKILLTIVLSFLLAATIAQATIPEFITLQGRLSDTNNNPLNGNYDFDLKIYDAASGGTLIWSETQNDIPVANGIFNILLGNVQTLDDDFDDQYWVEISVESSTLSPRVRLTSSPYAYFAENVDTTVIEEATADLYVNETGDTMTGKLNTRGIKSEIPSPSGFIPINYLPPRSGEFIEGSGVLINNSWNSPSLTIDHNAIEVSGSLIPPGYFYEYATRITGGKGLYVSPNITATGTIKSPRFCIGSSCITSWPSGSSGSDVYVNESGDIMYGQLKISNHSSITPLKVDASGGSGYAAELSSSSSGKGTYVYPKLELYGYLNITPAPSQGDKTLIIEGTDIFHWMKYSIPDFNCEHFRGFTKKGTDLPPSNYNGNQICAAHGLTCKWTVVYQYGTGGTLARDDYTGSGKGDCTTMMAYSDIELDQNGPDKLACCEIP